MEVQSPLAGENFTVLVDLLLPIKPLARAKTRLRGAAGNSSNAHIELVLALARDTLIAAAGSAVVRRAVVICSDEVMRRALTADGVEMIADEPAGGLNSALRYGEALLREGHPVTAVAALPADLPALRPEELERAVGNGLATGGRVFCTDQAGNGTTLLLAPPGCALEPRFGPGSAAGHRASGARELTGHWPGLRCDVDTAADLALARALGVGQYTRAALARAGIGGFTPGDFTVFPCDTA